MNRVSFSEHDQKKILNIDFSGCSPEQAEEVISRVKELILAEPENSILTLTNLQNIQITDGVIKAFKEMLLHNKKYVKKAAIFNLSPEYKNFYEDIMKASGRHLVVFDSEKNAQDWLLDQRVFNRYLDPITVEYSVSGNDQIKGQAIAKDISLGGICIFADKNVDHAATLLMKINIFEGEPPVEITGVVSWAGEFNLRKDKPFLIGLQFQKLSVQAHQKLFQYIVARSKEQIV